MNNLDKILKEQMEQFAPEAPNVWAAIETGIKNNAGSSNAGSSNAVVGSKIGMGILKVLAIASLPAAFIAYTYFANPAADNKQPIATTTQQETIQQKQESVNEAPVLAESTAKKEIEGITTIQNSHTYKAIKKITAIKESENNDNNNEALNNKFINQTQNAETGANSNSIKAEAKPKADNPQILQTEVKDESNLNEEIESVRKEEELEKPKEESQATVKILSNYLTPNNDGINDKYLIEIDGEKYYNLKIYNTRNELVFESNDKLNNWDGTHFKTGQVCAGGTYYGILVYKGADNSDVKTLKTPIQLIR